jgi:hypothetical protein
MIKNTLLILATAVTIPASTVSYFDGTFNKDDWRASIVAQSGNPAGFSAVQAVDGGNPGAFRLGFHSYGGAISGGSISLGHLYSYATWDPSTDGAIDSLKFQMDIAAFNTGTSGAVAFRPFLEQDGKSFYGSANQVSVNSAWTTFLAANLDASDFIAYQDSSNPDFSEEGGEITFGFLSANGTGFGFSETVFGVDNWSVTIDAELPTPNEQPVPEPATILGAAALGALILRRIRS